MAGAKFSPVLAAAAVGALLVALTQARGHCHSGRYYSGLELARDQITPPAAFLPTLGLAECSQQRCRSRGEAAPGPGAWSSPHPCLLLGVSGAMSRCPALHITAAGVTCHESRVTMSRCPAAGAVTGLVAGAGCDHRVDAGARDGKVMQSVSWDHTALPSTTTATSHHMFYPGIHRSQPSV